MYLKGLDELDRKILDLLTQNARYTYSELGERLGLSRVAIKNRMDALEATRGSSKAIRSSSTRRSWAAPCPVITSWKHAPTRCRRSFAVWKPARR